MAQDRFKYFRIEARELLDGLTKGLLDLESRGDTDVVNRLLRIAHTLKGAARIVGHRELADLAHQLEDVIGPLRAAVAPQRNEAALALLDRMSEHLAQLLASAAVPPAPPPPSASASLSPAPTRSASQTLAPAPAAGARPTVPLATAATPAPRADPGAVDDVLGGLAEIHTLVTRLRGVGDARMIEQRLDQIERELRAVRQDAERLRLLAAGTTFTALERTARDAGHAAGKRVTFTGSGGEIRVDPQVLATLSGALVQLVRNAVAHGIERPEDRAAAAKSLEGRVEIEFGLRGRRIAVTCRDDGRGIDLEAVRRAAEGIGLARDRARALDREQLIGLLLRGGITTSSEVTPLSGRGIGLDVVRDAAHVLGGEVVARTSSFGTEITILVPAQVTGLSALALGGGTRIAAVPLASVRRVTRSTAMPVLRGGDGLLVALDDVMVPFAPLARLLGAASNGAPSAIVIVDGGDGLAALGVDHVLGVDEIVVRALPSGAPIDPIVRGVALDAQGLPRPVLEPTAVVAAIRGMPIVTVSPAGQPPPILVVDDSLTTRMLEQSILESAGYEVDVASSAEEGLVKVAQRGYGLILVDVEMPGMDGFGFITALRADPAVAGIPAILVTSRNRPDDQPRGFAVGAQGYVVKSDFDQVKLLDMIRKLVRR
ncbi:MAG TPA: response regulator [Kofleriaceae bacterium]|nr:response regulator [Kofleriaceae bacterium]